MLLEEVAWNQQDGSLLSRGHANSQFVASADGAVLVTLEKGSW